MHMLMKWLRLCFVVKLCLSLFDHAAFPFRCTNYCVLKVSFNALAMVANLDQMGPPIGRELPAVLYYVLYWSADATALNVYLPSDPQALLCFMDDPDSDK